VSQICRETAGIAQGWLIRLAIKAVQARLAPFGSYGKQLKPKQKAIADSLRKTINAALPKATSKVWHGHPVWFIGENPVVGYSTKTTGVARLFWNGQAFGEPALLPVGKFHAAELKYADVAAIDAKLLIRCLRKAKTNIWDSVAWRKQALAKKRNA
jgi:hypothetical protein